MQEMHDWIGFRHYFNAAVRGPKFDQGSITGERGLVLLSTLQREKKNTGTVANITDISSWLNPYSGDLIFQMIRIA